MMRIRYVLKKEGVRKTVRIGLCFLKPGFMNAAES